MQDYRTVKDFRKIRLFDQMYDDPTYLSFFFMFDYYSEESPLFNGEARNYLQNVIQDDERVIALDNFIKILKKVNSEYPWFWQSVSGLESTRQYGNLAEPWQGAEKPSIEIECLETVELTVSGMIDLYKRAAYDFNRWVEVIPKNLRRFRMWVWVSEVRTFTGSKLGKASAALGALSANPNLDVLNNDSSIKSVKPYFKVELSHCYWDIDSTSDIFSSLNRTPEGAAAPKIKIFYENAISTGEYANSTVNGGDRQLGQMLGDIAKQKIGATIDGAIDRTVEKLTARLLLGNVYGLNLASSLQDAISAGSINGIANVVGGVINNSNSSMPSSANDLGKAYDAIALDSEGPIKEKVYDQIAPDSEGPLGGNVYDQTPIDSEGPINENVYK